MPVSTNTALSLTDTHQRIDMLLSPTTALSKQITYWLTSSGSLTALLEQQAGQPLRVERRFEGYRPLTLTQKKQMGYQGACLNRPMLGWVREVYLYGNSEQPWVAARSIFPLPSLQGNARRLQHLQGTPIGYVLFKRQNKLPNVRYFQKIEDSWCRHTVYDWHRRPLLISETFLPTFFTSLQC